MQKRSIQNRSKSPREKNGTTLPYPTSELRGASENNLQSVSATIPRGKITLCTGPSGSGKSSFAFDTLYAEGQRRYVESLSPYLRQFVEQMPKPKFEQIEGLSPAIAIEQKKHAGNPRSTVGTMTEIYDYLRLLYARLGTAYCPETKEKIEQISPNRVVERLLELPEGSRLHILAPIPLHKGETIQAVVDKWQKLGYLRLRLNKTYYQFDEEIPFSPKEKNELFLVVDRIALSKKSKSRLLEAIEKAAKSETISSPSQARPKSSFSTSPSPFRARADRTPRSLLTPSPSTLQRGCARAAQASASNMEPTCKAEKR